MGRITYGKSMAQLSCKLSCPPALWNPRESRLNGKSREAVSINQQLESLLLRIRSVHQQLLQRNKPFTAVEIKEAFQGSMQQKITFLSFYDQMMAQMSSRVGVDLRPNSHRSYFPVRMHLAQFIRKQYGVSDLAFSQLTEAFVHSFEQYLLTDLGCSPVYSRSLLIKMKKPSVWLIKKD